MIPQIAKKVFRSSKHVARDPREVSEKDMVKLYTKAYKGQLNLQKKLGEKDIITNIAYSRKQEELIP